MRENILEAIKADRNLITRLMTYFNLGEVTIRLYVNLNHHYLLIVNVLAIIGEYLGLNQNELIEEGDPFIPLVSKSKSGKQ